MIKNALAIFLSGLATVLLIFFLLGKTDVAKLVPADSDALIRIPHFIDFSRRALTSGALRELAEAGVGGGRITTLIEQSNLLRGKSFEFGTARFLISDAWFVVPSGAATIDPGRIPFLTIVDFGRAMLALPFAFISGSGGEKAKSYHGHALWRQGRLTISAVRNFLLFGDEEDVRGSIDAYEGTESSLHNKPETLDAGEKLLDKTADIEGVLLSNELLSDIPAEGFFDPRVLVATKNLALGAVSVRLDKDGAKGVLHLVAQPGKVLLPALDSDAAGKPFALARFLSDDQKLALGIRSKDMRGLTGTLMSLLFPNLDGERNNMKRKLTEMLVGEFLANLGPEIFLAKGSGGGFEAAAQVRDPGKFEKTLKSKKALEAKSEPPAAPEAAEGAPPYEKIDLQGKAIQYYLDKGLLYFASDAAGIDRMREPSGSAEDSEVKKFIGGEPAGSAFFTFDLTKTLRNILPMTTSDAVDRLLEKPWRVAAQVIDNGSSVRFEGGLDAQIGMDAANRQGLTAAEIMLHAARILLLAFGLFMGCVCIRRMIEAGVRIHRK